MAAGKDPVCMRIWGGLGNQMFQYAAGYALARRLGVELLIDPLAMDIAHAAYGLDVFGIKARVWEPPAAGRVATVGGLLGRGSTKGKKRAKLWTGPKFAQADFCHADDFATLGPGTYLSGYYQSEQFFRDCGDDIRALYALADVAQTVDADLIERAQRPNSVSVHVRRGDYVESPTTRDVHGPLGEVYYGRAHRLVHQLIGEPDRLIFSDDPDAADELTRDWGERGTRTVVRGQSREQDLWLMAQCANHIVANSSFSWWGAWLGRNPERHVVAPRQWFARDEMRKVYVDELYPAGWILL